MHPSDRETNQVDYDLAGLVRIRAADGSKRDLASLGMQLGVPPAPTQGVPDISIRFVERVEHGRLTALGGDAACSDDGFFVVDDRSGARARVPFEAIGARPEIVVERASQVPLLEAIVNLTVLANGGVALHACALEAGGSGLVVAGWPHGGKTTALIALAAQGARIVADDWTYLGADGRSLHGTVQRLHLSERHLRGLEGARARFAPGDRLRLRLQAGLRSFDGLLAEMSRGRGGVLRPLRKIAEVLGEHLEVTATPEQLFARVPVGDGISLERVFLVLVSSVGAVTVRRTDERDLAHRLVQMLQAERERFLGYFAKFRFAFPEDDNPLIDQAAQLERERLEAALAGRAAYTVHHPKGVNGRALGEAMRPYCW